MSARVSQPAVMRPDILLALSLVYLIWSSTYYAIRVVVHELPALGAASIRFVVAGVTLLLIARARGAPWPDRRAWLAAVPIGALLCGVGNGMVSIAERSIGSGVAAIVCGTAPIWAGVIGPIFGERATTREWLGMGLGLLGVAALASGGDLRADPAAAALLVLSPAGWAVGSMWRRHLPLAPGAMGAASQMVTGGIALALIGALAYLTIAGSLVAFSAYSHLIEHARPSLALSNAYVNPVLAVILGVVLGNEHVGPEVVVGAIVIVAAVFLLVGAKPDKS